MEVFYMDIPLLVQHFLIHLHETGKKHSTVSMYKHDLMAFFKWLNQHSPDITPGILPEEKSCYEEYLTYLKDKNLSEANLRRVASHLNRLLEYHNLTDQFGPLKATTNKQRDLVDSDFITEKDTFSLLNSVVSKKNLTETQLQIHKYIAPRNYSILILMLHYGLTLNEVVSLNINDINFSQNELTIITNKGKRVLNLSKDDKKIIYNYFSNIPALFKPKDYTDDPLFLSFHPQKMVYWYDYNLNKPKRISLIGVKRMIEKEVKRSGIQAKARSTQFRNSCILNKICEGYSNEYLITYFGLSSRHALYRYKKYLKIK